MRKFVSAMVVAVAVVPAVARANCEFYTDWDFGGEGLLVQKGECVVFDLSEGNDQRTDGMCANHSTWYTAENFAGNLSSVKLLDGASAGLKWYENGVPVVELTPFNVEQMGANNDIVVAVTCQ